jgi:hypothetical protein
LLIGRPPRRQQSSKIRALMIAGASPIAAVIAAATLDYSEMGANFQ